MRYVYAYIGSKVQKNLEKMTLTQMFQKGIYCSAFVGVAIPYVVFPPEYRGHGSLYHCAAVIQFFGGDSSGFSRMEREDFAEQYKVRMLTIIWIIRKYILVL